jgi:hypothetical protein
MPGIDINGSPIARDKWKPSSDKWNLIHICPIGQVIISVRYIHSYWSYTWNYFFVLSSMEFFNLLYPFSFYLFIKWNSIYSMTEVFCKALSDKHVRLTGSCLGENGFSLTHLVFAQYFFQWKKLHSGEHKKKKNK